MRKIGLTGGIGSGKSTVAAILARSGACVIDADAISKSLTLPAGRAMTSIREAFGAGMLAADGGLNRDAMRQQILKDSAAKGVLEGIIHPLIGSEISFQLQRALEQGAPCAVLDIPLLTEAGSRWRSQLDVVWVVDCLPATQKERVLSRSGWPMQQIEAVMAAQASRAERLAVADAVIFNDGISLERLEQHVLTLSREFNLATKQPQNLQ
jgi:dephospho-CoA kinase